MKARPEDGMKTIVRHDAVDTFASALAEAAGRPINDVVWLANHGNDQAMRVMHETFNETIHAVIKERWPGSRLKNLQPAALAELHREVRRRLAVMPMRHTWRWN